MDKIQEASFRVKQVDLMAKSLEKQEEFSRQILIAASSILGFVVALHDSTSEYLYIRLVFVSAMVVIGLCILSKTIVLYDLSMLVERVRQAHIDEYELALLDQRVPEDVSVKKKKSTLFFQKFSLFCFVLGLILLVTYACFSSLIGWFYLNNPINPTLLVGIFQ